MASTPTEAVVKRGGGIGRGFVLVAGAVTRGLQDVTEWWDTQSTFTRILRHHPSLSSPATLDWQGAYMQGRTRVTIHVTLHPAGLCDFRTTRHMKEDMSCPCTSVVGSQLCDFSRRSPLLHEYGLTDVVGKDTNLILWDSIIEKIAQAAAQRA